MGRKSEIIVNLAEHSLALQALVLKLADDHERLAARLDENDPAIELLVEDFDELDGELGDAKERLEVHDTWIADIGERLAKLESASAAKAKYIANAAYGQADALLAHRAARKAI